MDPARTALRLFGHVGPRRAVALLGVLAVVLLSARPVHARERLKVAVPDKENLQFVVFWAAKAGGLFDREGIDVDIVEVAPNAAASTEALLAKGELDAAIMAPPAYLRMIAARAPIILVANLFSNDPYALVARREAVDSRAVATEAPVRQRVAALKGLTIGYPPAAYGRLRALLASQGLDIEKDVKTQVLLARYQSSAFKEKGVDAAYLATPHLERLVSADNAVVVVNQARGDIPELANRQTHVLAVSQRTWEQRRPAVTAAVRAIAMAEKQLKAADAPLIDALARQFPTRDRQEVETLVTLYEPGVPANPQVRVEDLAPALALIPEGVPRPDLSGIDLAPFVASDVTRPGAGAEAGSPAGPRWGLIVLAVFVLGAIVLIVRRRRKG